MLKQMIGRLVRLLETPSYTHVVKKNQKSREKSHSTNRPIAADIAAADARSRIFSDYSKTVSSMKLYGKMICEDFEMNTNAISLNFCMGS